MRPLIARLDNVGDVLLTGPAVRAVAAGAGPVTFLAGPAGAGAARLLPGVGEVLEFDAPWVPYDARPVDRVAVDALVASVAERRIDEAIILTSFHQSPLPLALLLRLAGVGHIAATSIDYPGSLLDVRVPYIDGLHEVEQALAVSSAAGHPLSEGDPARLMIDLPADAGWQATPSEPYVVVHPAASVPARGLPEGRAAQAVQLLTENGWHVVVTGTAAEASLCRRVAAAGAGSRTHVAAGLTSLADLAALVRGAAAVVCGNTGVVHVAAAAGTPVIEAFAPVVAPHRWAPWGVDHVLLGDLAIDCAGCRSQVCPRPGQPCLAAFSATAVMHALQRLTGAAAPPLAEVVA